MSICQDGGRGRETLHERLGKRALLHLHLGIDMGAEVVHVGRRGRTTLVPPCAWLFPVELCWGQRRL
jgi:hypothetical protein